MRRYHRFFECESKRQAENKARDDLRCQNLEHRDIIHARCVVEHENERHKQSVGDYGRKSG